MATTMLHARLHSLAANGFYRERHGGFDCRNDLLPVHCVLGGNIVVVLPKASTLNGNRDKS